MTPLQEIPLVDGHLHPPLQGADKQPFARYFTEADDSVIVADYVPQTLFYRRALVELAELLGCAPLAESVQAARTALGQCEYLRLIAREANVQALLIDDGYPPADAISVEDIGEISGSVARRILRIETLAESLIVSAGSAADLAERLTAAIRAQNEIGALKTVIAYRCGLQLGRVSETDAERAFAEVRAGSGWNPPRLTSKPLLNFLLFTALECASERSLPVQFHTGYGDHDIDLTLANPALLKPMLEDSRLEGVPVVLLHAAYPYCREASYLASVYPNVWVDWSEVNPMLAPRQLRRVLEELLALAPFTKLLYGSDAWGIPDWIYLAARAGRTALWEALEGEPDRVGIAHCILAENARLLYRLEQ
jgi:predicted TIM-barrel fold metal-dependent hydrolase